MAVVPHTTEAATREQLELAEFDIDVFPGRRGLFTPPAMELLVGRLVEVLG